MTTLVCLILDVGAHMYEDLQQAVDCLKLLVQRDFFAQKKHEVALILCGVEASSNDVIGLGNKCPTHIALIRELAPLDWDILEFLNKESLLSTCDASVVDAISVAVRHLVEHAKTLKKVNEKRIILVSNLHGPGEDNVSDVLEACNAAEIQLSLIGFSLDDSGDSNDATGVENEDAATPGPSSCARDPQQNARNKLQPALGAIAELWRTVNGESYLFSEALPSLSLFEGRSIAQRGWKVDFQIGDNLSFPVEGFTQVNEARPPALKHLCASDPSTLIRPVTTYYSEQTNEDVEPSQVIRGYRYGNTLVPFTDEDKMAVKQSAEKCLSLIGFTKSSNVPRHLYVGNSVMVFVGSTLGRESESSSPAAEGLTALAQALFELDGVALVRRVYNRVSAPRLGVLTPEIRGSQLVLVYTDLAFAEDVRTFDFPSLPITSMQEDDQGSTTTGPVHPSGPSGEQIDAMDQFIDAMMLGTSKRENADGTGDHTSLKADGSDNDDDDDDDEDDEGESGVVDLKPERVPNPWIQRLFTCFRQRGLCPTEPLIPSTSHQQPPTDTSGWLSTQNLPGLERLISRLDPDPEIGLPEVLEARQTLLTSFPPLSPKHKSNEEGESEGVASKRRRLMAQELFGLDINSNPTSQTTSSPSASGDEAQLNVLISGDFSGNFERLVSQGSIEEARQIIERGIIHLVTNPFTPRVLRSRAVGALMTYRQRAVALGNIGDNKLALAYNAFLTDWKTRAIGHPSHNEAVNGGSQAMTSTQSDLESRRTFWSETISQGFGLITDTEVPGVGVSDAEAHEANACPWTAKSGHSNSMNLVVKDLLDDME